jgi:diguanylate cyclase (GGDEF)-like protein/PAS domain S-box-containing protein
MLWIALGLTGYAIGQILWDIQTTIGYAAFPAPSDLFYLLLAPCLVAGLVQEIRANTPESQRQTIWLDSAILTVALSTLVLVLYLPERGDIALLPLLVLVAYPCTLFAATSMTLIMTLALRLRLASSLWLFQLGLVVTTLSWMKWNLMALRATTVDGAWFNPSFSVAILLIGFSLTRWRIERSTHVEWDRTCEAILRLLPLAAVVIAAVAAVFSNTITGLPAGIDITVNIGGAVVVVLAMLRQIALLKERDQLLSAQAALIASQHQLALERSLLKTLVGTIPDLIWLKDPDGRYMSCNKRFEQFYGVSEQDILGKTDHHFTSPESADALCKSDLNTMEAGVPCVTEEWLSFANGAYRGLFEITRMPAYDEAGKLIGVLGVARDITQSKQAETDLRIAASAFESQQGMIITDAKTTILRVNRAFTEIAGYTAAEAVGQTPRLFQSGRHSREFYASMWECIHRTGVWQGEVWDRRKNGEVFPKWLTISAVTDNSGTVTHYVGTHFDITERKKAEEKITELAFFDSLTGLPNRTLLADRIRQAMAASARDATYGALLFIDLDHFKTLNDTLGHDMGDLLLTRVAQHLRGCVREGDTVARLGGDEFVVMLAGLGSGQQDAAANTESIANHILSTLGQTYQLGDIAYNCTASIGVTLFNGREHGIEELMKQADLAMYRSKAGGRSTFRFFDPAMESAVMERAKLDKDLRQAIEEKQFVLYYQAQVVGDGHVTGAEVLLRWKHPHRGLVSPSEFIPLAEETGLIVSLGHWVLETSCAQLALWGPHPDMNHLTVAVNVSADQLRKADFVEQVLGVLERTGANPRRLKLELTESLLVSNFDDTIEKMFALKAKGLGFSLDDFGTGYSSLAYLKRLPLDQLKIDRSFVRDVLTDPNDAAIAKTIIALAQSLGLSVIAEGVETREQRSFLAQAGCYAYQGYHFHRPMALAGFEEFAHRSLSMARHRDGT